MRLSFGLLGLGLCATGLAQSCSSYSMDQCASDCGCQRVACCCGAGCDKQGSTVQYNACVPANSPYNQWTGCPAANSCAASAGLVRTITPCVVPTPSPTAASPTASSDIPFGTTFPMIGTQALAHQTWQDNVYMGTTTNFNAGGFFGYTNSYSVPSRNSGNYDGNYDGYDVIDNNGNISPTAAPTPADATGQPCVAFSSTCPTGYYCKVNSGYNVQQKGTCQKEAADTWTGGAGKFTDSQYYTSLTHPPLVTDPNHNGPSSQGYGDYYGSGYGYGSGYSSGSGYGYGSGYSSGYYPGIGGVGGESCGPLPSGAPVCGYKSYSGSCFCDTDCAKTGDCCVDYAQWCGVLSNQYTGPVPITPYSPPVVPYTPYTPPVTPYTPYSPNTPAYSPPATGTNTNCDAVGQCAGLCGSSAPAIGVNGRPCYCDSSCAVTGDCCCSQAQCIFR